MDLLFSSENGIGLSILRSEVGNGLNMPMIHPDKDTWDFTPYEPEQWVLQEATVRGVETIMSTVWSPPAWMKTKEQIVRGGHLKKEYGYEPATLTGGYWERIVVKLTQELPQGTNFLKVCFDGGEKAWDKHLTEMHID